MKEVYVSYEVAKLLKEKGFHWNTCYYTLDQKTFCGIAHGTPIDHNMSHNSLSVPTQQMAMRWLREEHNIFIGVDIGEDLDGEFGYMPFIHILDNLSCSDGKYVPHVEADDICDFTPQTYEDAVEVALEYALKDLI